MTQGNFGFHESGRISRPSDTNDNSVSITAMRPSVILSQINALKLHGLNFLLAHDFEIH